MWAQPASAAIFGMSSGALDPGGGMSGKSVEFRRRLASVQTMANLAVRAGSGCAGEGSRRPEELDRPGRRSKSPAMQKRGGCLWACPRYAFIADAMRSCSTGDAHGSKFRLRGMTLLFAFQNTLRHERLWPWDLAR